MFKRCICDRRRQRYDLTCCNLTQVPSDVGRNRNTLIELVLDSNHLNELGRNVYRCNHLQRLYATNNNLSAIPDEIGTLKELVELNLSHNEIDEISDDIRNCQDLQFLDISNNSIRRIPNGIFDLYSLEVLNINECSLNEIPDSIKQLKSLRSIEARDNLIDQIPDSIGNLTSLIRLDLGCNEISRMTPEISKLVNLSELWLDTNILTSIPSEIGFLKNLVLLDLSNNPIKVIPDSICKLENLKELALTSNQLTSLPTSIGNLMRLENLKVDFNRITELPRSIGRLENLIELSILGNQLTSLPNTIENLKNLICVYADSNKITSLPEEICECTSLNILSFRDNCLTQLPENFGNLKNVGVVELRGNRIQYLPKSMVNMKSLRCLWLSCSQQKPLYELQLQNHPKYGEILTCFLLPQKPKENHVGCSQNTSTSEDHYTNPAKTHYDQSIKVLNKNRLSSVEENPEYMGFDSRRESEIAREETMNALDSLTEHCEDRSSQNEVLEEYKVFANNFSEKKIDPLDNDLNWVKRFFKLETVNLDISGDDRGFEICGGIDNIYHVFGNSESAIFIKSVSDTEEMKKLGLKVGDRIISVNGLSMSLVTNAEANRLIELHGPNLTLLVRHDPPPQAFEVVTVVREDDSQMFGISFALINEGPPKYSPLVLGDVLENGILYSTGKVKKGMWLVEINDEFMIRYSRDDAARLLTKVTGVVKLVFFNPSYKETEMSTLKKVEKDDVNGQVGNTTESYTTNEANTTDTFTTNEAYTTETYTTEGYSGSWNPEPWS